MNSNPAELAVSAELTVAACRRRGWLVLAGVTLVLVAVTAALTALNVDLKLAGRFYDPGQGWFLGHAQP